MRRRKGSYPWRRWFDSGHFRLLAGRDYHCSTLGMAQQVRDYAGRKAEVRVAISEIPGGLEVTVLKEEKCRS